MQAYVIFIKAENDIKVLMTESVADIIKENHGAVVLSGFNPQLYVACLAFGTYQNRDTAAAALAAMGITYKTRDDGIVSDRFRDVFFGGSTP